MAYLAPSPKFQAFDSNGDPLASGKLYAYQAGTDTPLDTYQSQGGAANTNPVILNSRGEANVWLSATSLYKLVLKTSADATIWTVDNVGGAVTYTDLSNTSDVGLGDALVGFKQSNGSGALTGATARTVHTKLQEVFSVKDFGAVGDKVTDDATAIQAAIDAAKAQHHGTIYFPNAVGYRVNSALDVTGTSGLRFVCEGGNNSSYASIYPNHTGHVFDCSDSSFLTFENVAVRTFDNTTKPKTAWFLARNSSGDSAGNHEFYRCATYGKFSSAVLYSYASESNEYHHCFFANQETGGNVFVSTAYNIFSLSSTFITIATGSRSNIITNIFGGSMAMLAATGNSVYLDGAALFNMYGTELFSSDGSATGGNSLVYVDCTNSASDYVRLHDVTGENFGGSLNPAYAIYFNAGASPVTCSSWDISNFRMAAATNAIYGESTVTLSGFNFNNISNVSAGSPTSSIDKIEYSVIYLCNTFTFRTSALYTELHGALSSFTVPSTRTGTVIFDTLTGSVDRGRATTMTIPANPADVSVPTASATTLFDAVTYLGGGQDMEFTFYDDATILGRGWVGRPNSGSVAVNLRSGATGSGVALSMSGTNVQLTHTVGTTRTVSLRIFPASSTVQ